MTLATYLLGWALKALGLALLLDAKCVTCKRTSLEFGQRPASASQLMQRRFSTQSAPQFFNQLRSRVNVTPLRWRVLQHFEPLQTQPDPDCSNVGVRFPHLVSRNKSVLDAFKSYACGEGAGYFVTDPSIALTATVAELREGCVNLQPWPEMIQAANATHGEYIYRSCNANCSMREGKSIRPLIVDEDLLVVSSLRVWPGMPYQHALLDMLAPVWSVVQDTAFQNSSVKIVVNHPLHVSMLKSLGLPEDRIFEIKFGSFQRDSPKLLLCTKQTLHLWRAGGPLGEILPTLQYGDGRMYSDFWHRLINWQVGLKISDKMMQEAGMQDKPIPARVIFLQRCSDKRKIANEQDALGLTSSVLVRSNRSELLTSFCGGREELLEQMWEMRGASLVLGQHGGALANILFAPQDAGIVEFVGSPAAHQGLPGVWPPYKSYWYGGAGAAFKFFRVVLYDLDSHGAWQLRLEDLEEALQQWTDHNSGTMRPM